MFGLCKHVLGYDRSVLGKVPLATVGIIRRVWNVVLKEKTSPVVLEGWCGKKVSVP